ncbi:unnamed protein product [Staurois parvus]|uniref:Uncharacterized protein n=1 Tax=Staurois parvus TaxID=386267 RepID=A0ABN9EUY1_9NEOB|nr:unnamed protein product [Staurois parvus]
MRCPWYLSYAFLVWARTQGPHDPLLPRGPMSCQFAPLMCRSNVKVNREWGYNSSMILEIFG